MGNPHEAPRFSETRRMILKGLLGVAGSAAMSTIGCSRQEDSSPPPASDVPPGKKLLDEGSQRLAEKAREAAGMGSPTAAPLQAKEMTPRPTMAGPDYQATTVAQQTEIAQLRAPAKTPEPAKPPEKPKREGDFEITLKPEELYRALLTTPFDKNSLPQGFIVEKGPYTFSANDPMLAYLRAYMQPPIQNLAGTI